MEEKTLTVEGVSILKTLNATTQVLDIRFKEIPEEKVIMFEDYTKAMDYINSKVIVTFRSDIHEGKVCKCVNNLTRLSVVSTLDKEDNIKLFAEGLGEMPCTCIFSDIEEGANALNIILYCSKTDFKTSKRARWLEFKCMDKFRKVSTIRQFNPVDETVDFSGKFIQLDMWKNQYGFNTEAINVLDSIEAPVNPQLTLASNYIVNSIKDDEELIQVINKTNLLKKMSEYDFEEEIERGYEVVRLAIEIDLIKEMANLTSEVNIQLMIRSAILSRGYVLTNNKDQSRSKMMQNILNSVGFKIGQRKDILTMLDNESPKRLIEKELLIKVKELAEMIVLGNKTYLFDKI